MSVFGWGRGAAAAPMNSAGSPAEGRPTVRKRIRFTGRVQGVGFRYQATRLARALGLTGWVRNEDDGSVLMEVQGTETGIGHLLLELEEDRYIRIESTDIERLELKNGERGFGPTGY